MKLCSLTEVSHFHLLDLACTSPQVLPADSPTCHRPRDIDGESLTGDQWRTWSALPGLWEAASAHGQSWQVHSDLSPVRTRYSRGSREGLLNLHSLGKSKAKLCEKFLAKPFTPKCTRRTTSHVPRSDMRYPNVTTSLGNVVKCN